MNELSPRSEQYLASVVAGGMYPSKEAALEAAIEALRAQHEDLPFVPPEHMEQVEDSIRMADAGETTPLTEADWERLRQLAHDVARAERPHD